MNDEDDRLDVWPQWRDLTAGERADLITLFIIIPFFLFPAMTYMVLTSP
jgi:hypothetical protein